ncbi:hypothetical protein DCCM_0623 [Desulfocucumis palustris]|uniref:Uncharacterized protein n=1 Tax=Desulfocucumis palustris TaxID=1898651 RepID=A0A2L2X899_9FIRM|nr:hypothetical protein DCCM_0623 [Desulfocucumis palustris]
MSFSSTASSINDLIFYIVYLFEVFFTGIILQKIMGCIILSSYQII